MFVYILYGIMYGGGNDKMTNWKNVRTKFCLISSLKAYRLEMLILFYRCMILPVCVSDTEDATVTDTVCGRMLRVEIK